MWSTTSRWPSPGKNVAWQFGISRGQIPPHRRRNEDVGLSLPEKHDGLDLVEAEPPRPAEQHDIQCRTPAALSERFRDVRRQNLTYLRPAHDFSIGG